MNKVLPPVLEKFLYSGQSLGQLDLETLVFRGTGSLGERWVVRVRASIRDEWALPHTDFGNLAPACLNSFPC